MPSGVDYSHPLRSNPDVQERVIRMFAAGRSNNWVARKLKFSHDMVAMFRDALESGDRGLATWRGQRK